MVWCDCLCGGVVVCMVVWLFLWWCGNSVVLLLLKKYMGVVSFIESSFLASFWLFLISF